LTACSGPITEEAPIAQYVKVGRVDAITVETPYFRNAHRGEYRELVQRGARNIYVDHRLVEDRLSDPAPPPDLAGVADVQAESGSNPFPRSFRGRWSNRRGGNLGLSPRLRFPRA